MKRIVLIVIATVLAIVVSPVAQANISVTKLAVSATGLAVSAIGANEKPISGAKTGSASGTFILDSIQNTMCFTNMKTKGITGVIGAHIHLGVWGMDGSIFVPFNISNFNRVGTSCVKVVHTVLVDIASHPSDYYFNVHTKVFPDGAVRGQLRKSS